VKWWALRSTEFASSFALTLRIQLLRLMQCLKNTLYDDATRIIQNFGWYSSFKSSKYLVEDFEPSGHPLSNYSDENEEKVHQVVHVNRLCMI
jgi:hypothetical protein